MASPFPSPASTMSTSSRLQKSLADRRRPSTSRRSRVSLVDQAYAEIRRRILDNEYAPAQQVLEQDLAAELGMSRTPVREALVRLEHEQFVQLIPRHGMRVVPLSLQDLRDVYDVIAVLELAAIERLVNRRPEAGVLAPLDAAVEEMERASHRGELDAWVRADARFHGALMELSGNARLASLASSMADQVHRARIATVRLRESLEPSNHEHRVLLRAIHQGDLVTALSAHTTHRQRTSDEILGILERTRLGSF
jgi:DNA-binding GntR family transcriptional regulator